MAEHSVYRALFNIIHKKVDKDGTPLAGFVTASENKPPRECGNCRHFKPLSPGSEDGHCVHPVVNADPKLQDKKDDSGKVLVDTDDCCDYFQNKRK